MEKIKQTCSLCKGFGTIKHRPVKFSKKYKFCSPIHKKAIFTFELKDVVTFVLVLPHLQMCFALTRDLYILRMTMLVVCVIELDLCT